MGFSATDLFVDILVAGMLSGFALSPILILFSPALVDELACFQASPNGEISGRQFSL